MSEKTTLDRELRIKQADWAYEQLRVCAEDAQRYRAAFVIALSVLIGWVANRAFQGNIAIQDVDAQFAAGRLRPDIAAAICCVPILHSLYIFFVLPSHGKAVLHKRLLREAQEALGFKWVDSPVARHWYQIGGRITTTLGYIVTALAIWYTWPAARASTSIARLWWCGFLLTVIQISTMARFMFSMGVAAGLKEGGADALTKDDLRQFAKAKPGA